MVRAGAVLAAGLLLGGCTGDGDEPTVTPSVTRPAVSPPAATTPAPQGPTSGAAVPSAAFLSPADLGSGWTRTAPATLPCAPRLSPRSSGSVGLSEGRGTLTEALATGIDVSAGVAAWKRSLEACDYEVRDEPLGDAGLRALAPDGSHALLVTGTEEVLVVLHASGPLSEAEHELEGWADLALGTSCVAAADGCH